MTLKALRIKEARKKLERVLKEKPVKNRDMLNQIMKGKFRCDLKTTILLPASLTIFLNFLEQNFLRRKTGRRKMKEVRGGVLKESLSRTDSVLKIETKEKVKVLVVIHQKRKRSLGKTVLQEIKGL